MSFVDRIGGRPVEQPPARTFFGRWLVNPGEKPGSMHLNGCTVSDGDVLAPGATEDWTLLRPDHTRPIRGNFLTDALPDDQDVEALLELGQFLRNPDRAKGGWGEWSDISPLAPELNEAVKPHPFEDSIERELNHLTTVCRNPRTHIHVDTERVLVARARRIAPDAPAWLASHTEDWDHRKITGIEPRRILAEVREEQWDLYENRLAVRLIDGLVTWLRRRIAEVRRVLDDIFARMEGFDGSESTRYRTERICRLWGEAWARDANLGRQIAECTLRRLESLLCRVLGLMDSRLYQRISMHAQASGELRMTNLLSNDDHYRGVARLWHKWSRLVASHALSPRELYSRRQDLHRGFDAWCMLVIVRACSQLNLDPAEDREWESEIRPGSAVRLDKDLRIEWEQVGTITLVEDDRTLIRFVPLVHVLEHAKTPVAVETRVAPLVEAVSDVPHWTVILHPAVPGEPPHDALAGIGNPPVPGTHGAVDFIRVSPFSLDSVERVSRAIRWATLAPRMLSYPPTLQANRELDIGKKSWIVDRRDSGLALIRPLSQEELSELDIAGRLATACRHRDSLTRKRENIQGELQRARGDRRRTSELNREKGRLLEPVRNAEQKVKLLEEFNSNFERARENVAVLGRCPACGIGDTNFEARENDCFAASCRSESCDSRWELHHDPETSSRIPVFFRDSESTDRRRTDKPPQWVDDVLGCDVLAVPDAGGRFLPPRQDSRSALP